MKRKARLLAIATFLLCATAPSLAILEEGGPQLDANFGSASGTLSHLTIPQIRCSVSDVKDLKYEKTAYDNFLAGNRELEIFDYDAAILHFRKCLELEDNFSGCYRGQAIAFFKKKCNRSGEHFLKLYNLSIASPDYRPKVVPNVDIRDVTPLNSKHPH